MTMHSPASSLNAKDLFRCMCLMTGKFPRLFSEPSSAVDAIFVWGRAVDEWQATQFDDGILSLAAKLHFETGAPIAIPGYVGSQYGQSDTGYPGPEVWRQALEDLNVVPGVIIPVEGSGHNTKTEMDDFINFACRCKMKSVIAISQQSHALRAMLGTVQTMRGLSIQDLLVYPFYPEEFDWTRQVYGSQGLGPLPRHLWIDEEFGRIPLYQEQGDLCTLSELYEYLCTLHQRLAT